MKDLSKSLLALALVGITTSASATTVVNQYISRAEVVGAQKAWCQALVDISSTYDKDGQQDKGFALKGWSKCESQNAGVFITGDSAT
jgi:hypothetical protein